MKAPGSAKRTTFLPAQSWWRDVPVKPARGACGALGGRRRAAVRRDSVVSGPKKLRRRRRRTAGRRVRAVRLGRVPRARRLQITRRQLQQIETRGDAAARRGAACGSRASECGAEHGCCDAVASGSEEKLGFKRHTSSKSQQLSAKKITRRFARYPVGGDGSRGARGGQPPKRVPARSSLAARDGRGAAGHATGLLGTTYGAAPARPALDDEPQG